MNKLFLTLRHGWNAARAIRVGIGLAVLVLAAIQHDKIMLFFGGWLTLMPLLNLSCCGSGGCDIDHSKTRTKSIDNDPGSVTFVEINAKDKSHEDC